MDTRAVCKIHSSLGLGILYVIILYCPRAHVLYKDIYILVGLSGLMYIIDHACMILSVNIIIIILH